MKDWSCRDCDWSGQSGDEVVAYFHRCRPRRVRRRLTLDDLFRDTSREEHRTAIWHALANGVPEAALLRPVEEEGEA